MQEILKLLIPIVLVHFAVLVAVVIVIKRMLMGDTTRAMARIAEVEAEVRKKEEGIRQQINEHEQDFARKKTEAEEALQLQREESETEVARIREQVIAEAKTEAERIISHAKRNEQKMRDQVMLSMEEKAVDYGAQIFHLVFSEKMTATMDREFVNELLDALAEVDASSMTVDTSEAEFILSHPLDAEQKVRLEALLAEKFETAVKVAEKLNPNLLAGMVMKLGSLEIDGSLLNRYRDAAVEVTKNAAHA